MDDRTTPALTRALVKHLVFRRDEAGEKGGAQDKLTRYAITLIGSRIGPSHEVDEGAVLEAIRKELRVRGGADVTRFSELHSNMMASSTNPLRCSLLQLLLRVARDAAHTSVGSSSSVLGTSLTSGVANGQLPSLSHESGPGPNASFNSSIVDLSFSSSVWEGGGQLPAGGGGQRAVVAPRAAALSNARLENTDFEVPETLLVRSVIYAAQGIDSKYIRYDPSEDAYVVDPNVGVPATQRTLLRRLCEIGWLYRKLNAHAGAAVSAQGGVLEGSVRQAFCSALQQELANYFRMMAVLEGRAHLPLPDPTQPDPPGESPPYLTLRRLHVWFAEPLRRLRILAALADSVKGLKGGALASAVHRYAQHGDPFVRDLLVGLLTATCAPIYDMLEMWMMEGRLEDPHEEFFIVKDAEGFGRDLWREGYRMKEEQLPPMIDGDLAASILRCGKSIIFLTHSCGDTAWVAEHSGAAGIGSSARLAYGQDKALEKVVKQACAEINSRVIAVLFDRYNFSLHCHAIKKYLLGEQGDFISVLMDTLKADLDDPAAAMSQWEYKLAGKMEIAIRSSNAQYEEPEVLDCLGIKCSRAVGAGERGWDVFSLSYDVREPLSTVLTPANMLSYKRVFKLLWDVKHVEHSLSAAWHIMKPNMRLFTTEHLNGPAGALWDDLRRCMSLRSDMSNFTTNLQYYFVFEVLEGSWEVFLTSVKKAADLDELISAHEIYLATLMRKSLLDEESQQLHAELYKLFAVMHDFLAFMNRLHSRAQEARATQQVQQLQAGDSGSRGQWGAQSRPEELVSEDELFELKAVLDNIHQQYNTHLNSFVALLPAQTHVDLRFLKFRLNFTDFYTRGFDDSDDESAPNTPHSPY